MLFVRNEISHAASALVDHNTLGTSLFFMAFLPCVIEELAYRGVMFGSFHEAGRLKAILMSGFLFGLMHMNFNQILYAIYLGIVFALLVEATGSLVSTMILHMLFNALNTSYLYLLPKLYEILGSVSSQYANFDIEAELAKTPERGTLYTMLEALAPMAAIGVVLMILILFSNCPISS